MLRVLRIVGGAVLASGLLCAAVAERTAAQSPGGAGEADALFRNLDTDGNGRLTSGDANPRNERMLQQVVQMAGKQPGEAVSRDEFQVVYDRVRGGGGRPPQPGTPPTPPIAPPVPRPTATGEPRPGGASGLNAPAGTTAGGVEVWRGWVVDGRGENPNTGHMQIELTITGNRIVGREIGTNRAPPGGLGSGTFTMTGDGRSGTLDAVAVDGPNQGKQYPGIFQIDGDVLRWCVSNRDRQRPEAMATDRGNYLMILRRVVN